MSASAAYARRAFAGGGVTTTVPLGITSTGQASFALAAATNWPTGSTGTFFIVADRGLTNLEEKMEVTSNVGGVLTIAQRGADGSTAAIHAAGCIVSLCHVARDDDEANQAVNQTLGAVTTQGDLLYASTFNPTTFARLPIGSAGQNLTVVTGAPAWAASATSTLSVTGDLLYASAANTLARLAIGATGTVLEGGATPSWGVLPGTLLGTLNYTTSHAYTVATSMTALDTTNLTLAFTVPASGNVDIDVQLAYTFIVTVTASVFWANILNHTGGAALGTATMLQANGFSNTTEYGIARVRFHLTGLTPGALQVDLAAQVQSAAGTSATINTGAASTSVVQTPLVMQAFAA